jgi:predicted DNA-binding transcriptional regulator YafY
VQGGVHAEWAVALFPTKVAQEQEIKNVEIQQIVVASFDQSRNNKDQALFREERQGMAEETRLRETESKRERKGETNPEVRPLSVYTQRSHHHHVGTCCDAKG